MREASVETLQEAGLPKKTAEVLLKHYKRKAR